METTNPAGHVASPIAQALACYDKAYSARRQSPRERGGPAGNLQTKFKPLVLEIEPRASVHRVGKTSTAYAGFIGSKRIGDTCGCAHTKPEQAWVCLARHLAEKALA